MRWLLISTIFLLLPLWSCSRHHDSPTPSGVTDSRRDRALALVKAQNAELLGSLQQVVVNTSRGSATKQRPFYCPNEVVVNGFAIHGSNVDDSTTDFVNRSWRVDLKGAIVQGPTEDNLADLNKRIADIEAAETPSPQSVPRCLDGSGPLSLDPDTLPDEHADEP